MSAPKRRRWRRGGGGGGGRQEVAGISTPPRCSKTIENIKERLKLVDAEWNAIRPLVEKGSNRGVMCSV
jgi:hypothetical protein